MKFLILILSLLLPFGLAYLIKNNNLNLFFVILIILLFSLLVVSHLIKNNRNNQYSLKSFLLKKNPKK